MEAFLVYTVTTNKVNHYTQPKDPLSIYTGKSYSVSLAIAFSDLMSRIS